MQIPYQKALDTLLARLDETGERPTLLLHCCCAPCSSYVLQYLHAHFRLVLFFYNPNISPQAEYDKRLAELRRMLADMGLLGEVHLIEGRYEPERFFAAVRGLEDAPEGGFTDEQPEKRRRSAQTISAPRFPSARTRTRSCSPN